MSIILLILKIIGIVLLVILGCLLLLVLAVLLIPVRYQISGEAKEQMLIKLRVSWLRPCISWRVRFEEGQFAQKLLIFGIPLKKRKEEERKPKKKGRPKKKRKSKKKPETVIQKSELTVHKPEPEEEAQKPQGEMPEAEVQVAEPGSKKKKGRLDTVRAFFYKLKQLPGMIKSKWESLKEKVLNLKETLGRIRTEFEDETNRSAVKLLFTELMGILKHFAPRRVKADVSFSAGEPATTGQALGVISMFPSIYRYSIHLYPDFEADALYFKGTFDIKGHIRGVHVLILIIHLIKDKNIRSLIQRYRNS